MATMIRLQPGKIARLDKMKVHPQETYDEVLNHILDQAFDTEPISEETLIKIEEAISDLRKGKFRPFEEVVLEHGLQ